MHGSCHHARSHPGESGRANLLGARGASRPARADHCGVGRATEVRRTHRRSTHRRLRARLPAASAPARTFFRSRPPRRTPRRLRASPTRRDPDFRTRVTAFWQGYRKRTCWEPRVTRRGSYPPTGTTQNTEGWHIPATDGNQDDDALSSVSETTAVETGLRMDPGSRAQARARELEDEISRFCADPSNRITVSCRNYIITRVFELVGLCSDLRADAAWSAGRPPLCRVSSWRHCCVGGRRPNDGKGPTTGRGVRRHGPPHE
ncbi:hypothetical protein MTO96_040690 [Rhipicephalus appendiculatus]